MRRLIIYFALGNGTNTARCRLVVGDPRCSAGEDWRRRDQLEKASKDALGKPAWIPLDTNVRGMPTVDQLVRRALHLTYDRATDLQREPRGLRLWPEGVTATDDGMEIELGPVIA